jgi:redox-sensitive bicupin YhaK (pirin superfamily)
MPSEGFAAGRRTGYFKRSSGRFCCSTLPISAEIAAAVCDVRFRARLRSSFATGGLPAQFAPANEPRGVGEHPHRGFETVTIVYEGEVEHRDSTGAGGRIGPGDVQWMTAASGILHEEFHSPEFTRSGGTLEMVQVWVNLPAKDKMSRPGFQTLLNQHIPSVDLPDEAGHVRVIAGEFGGYRGPARIVGIDH